MALIERHLYALPSPVPLRCSLLSKASHLFVADRAQTLRHFKLTNAALELQSQAKCERDPECMCLLEQQPASKVLLAQGTMIRAVTLEGKPAFEYNTFAAERISLLVYAKDRLYFCCDHVINELSYRTSRFEQAWFYMAEQRVTALWLSLSDNRLYAALNAPLFLALQNGKVQDRIRLPCSATCLLPLADSELLILGLKNGRIASFDRNTKHVELLDSKANSALRLLCLRGKVLLAARDDCSVASYSCEAQSVRRGELVLKWSVGLDERISNLHPVEPGFLVVMQSGKVLLLEQTSFQPEMRQIKDGTEELKMARLNEQLEAFERQEAQLEKTKSQMEKTCKRRAVPVQDQLQMQSSCQLAPDPESCCLNLLVYCQQRVEQLCFESSCALLLPDRPDYQFIFKKQVAPSKMVVRPHKDSCQILINIRLQHGVFGSAHCLILCKGISAAHQHQLELKALPYYMRAGQQQLDRNQLNCILQVSGEYSRSELVIWLAAIFSQSPKLTDELIELIFTDERIGAYIQCKGGARQVTFRSNSACDLQTVQQVIAVKAKQRGLSISCELQTALSEELVLTIGQILVAQEQIERRRKLIPALKELGSFNKQFSSQEWDDILDNEEAILVQFQRRIWMFEYLQEYMRSLFKALTAERRVVSGLAEQYEQAIRPINPQRLLQILKKL